MDKVLVLSVLFLLASTFVEAQITYVQPERFIRCPIITAADELCEIQLTVSSMQTLVAYNVDSDNVSRGDSGYQVTVNEQGGFDFVLGTPSEVTQLFQPIVADGTTRRNLLVINDQLPGPTIIGYKNQRIRINVTNNLGKEAITLHWHGQHVNGSNGSQNQYSDGVPYITQCPIEPSNSFVYDFRFYPAGTYWYHSHQYDERSNGMYGGLIVLDPDETNEGFEDIPEEHTITFFEWFPVNSDSWLEAPYSLPDPLNSSVAYSAVPTNDGTEAGFPPFFAGFMNFGGWRYNPSAADCTRAANNTLPFFNVSMGTSYRFRLVGSQVNYAYRFSIAEHRLRVIATDGIDATVTGDQLVDYLIMHVGERYDVIVDASQPVDNYLMLVETLEVPSVLAERGYCIKAHRGYAVLHYDGAPGALPSDFDDSYDPLTRCTTATNPCIALNCPFQAYPADLNITCLSVLDLELTHPEAVPNINVNPSAFLNFGFGRGPSVNDRVFEFPQSPPLSQEEDIPPNLFCQFSTLQQPVIPNNGTVDPTSTPTPVITPEPPFTCVHTYSVNTDTVEMVYSNLGTPSTIQEGAAHPIHLHGHHFFVLDIGYPSYFPTGTVNSSNGAVDCSADGGICNVGARWTTGAPPSSPCMADDTCPLKDTVIVPIGGWVRIRFPRNNWGWWIMHCHIEPHLLGGMAMVVNETSVPGNFPVPNSFPTCANFDFSNQSPTVEPSTEPLVNPSQFETYRNATIALAVISGVLLIALIAVVIALCAVSCCKKGNKPNKVEIELK